MPSQLNCDTWDKALADYANTDICNYLRYGWPVTYTTPKPLHSTPINHASALRHPKEIDAFLQKELKMHAILGPFSQTPFTPWTKVSPLMTRDKPSGHGKQVITDLSFPPGESVNNGISKNFFQGKTFCYSLLAPLDLADAILKAGKGAFLWEADLERAYRELRIDPLNYLLTIQHRGATYIDICPSFRCHQSGGSQQHVVHIMEQKGFKTLAYVDDFCGVAASLPWAAASFKRLTTELGLKLAKDKTTLPTQNLEFLGLEFDTEVLTITIPQPGLERSWMKRGS